MIMRKVGDTISVRTTVKENGTVKVITGGTAKARLKGRSTGVTLDATVTLTEMEGIIDADFAPTSVVDNYEFGCRLTLNDEIQTVSTDTFKIIPSVYS